MLVDQKQAREANGVALAWLCELEVRFEALRLKVVHTQSTTALITERTVYMLENRKNHITSSQPNDKAIRTPCRQADKPTRVPFQTKAFQLLRQRTVEHREVTRWLP